LSVVLFDASNTLEVTSQCAFGHISSLTRNISSHLFLISGNDTKFSYDLIKFYSSQEQD